MLHIYMLTTLKDFEDYQKAFSQIKASLTILENTIKELATKVDQIVKEERLRFEMYYRARAASELRKSGRKS